MRKFKNTIHKVLHWEYWNTNVLYFPIYFYWIFLSIKARSLGFFNADNPGIKNGVFAMESKKEIYDLIPKKHIPETFFFEENETFENIINTIHKSNIQFPFVLGLMLNSLNFMQWPYWSGMYLYLFRTGKIKPKTRQNNIFIMGALLGTFAGMMLFAQTGNYFLIDKKAIIGNYLNTIFTLLFSGLVVIQLINLFWKRRKVNLI